MYYEPWIGDQYPRTRVALVSESGYSWPRNNPCHSPTPQTPTGMVSRAIEDLTDVAEYYVRITKAICGKHSPSLEERKEAWHQYAYSIFIPGSVGNGAGGQRTAKMWREGGKDFLSLIEELKPIPERVIMTGVVMWSKMPKTDAQHPDSIQADRIQAYRIKSGDLVWCLAVPHTANRKEGFDWKDVAKRIGDFRSMSLASR